MSENQNENERKPVAAFQDTSGGKERLIVVCDDGSAWRRLISEGDSYEWAEMRPVPGTAREREKGLRKTDS